MTDKEYLIKKVDLLEKMVGNLNKRLHLMSEIVKRLNTIEDYDSQKIDLIFDNLKSQDKFNNYTSDKINVLFDEVGKLKDHDILDPVRKLKDEAVKKALASPKKKQCKNCKYLIDRHANERGHGGGRCNCKDSCNYKYQRVFSDTACKCFEEWDEAKVFYEEEEAE